MINTLHPYCVTAMAFDFCPHHIQTIGKVGDFRFARRVDNFCFTACQHRRHQRIFSSPDRHHREHDAPALQSVTRSRLNIASRQFNNRTKRLHCPNMQIYWPGTNRTATRQRNTCLAIARQERSQHQNRCPHFGNQLIRRIKNCRPARHRNLFTIANHINT